MSFATIIGICGSAVNMVCYVPQIYKLYRTKEGKDVSAKSYMLFACNTLLLLIYSSLKGEPIFIITSATSLAQNLLVLYLKHMYDSMNRTTSNNSPQEQNV